MLPQTPKDPISLELIGKSGKVGVLSPNLVDFVIFSDDKALQVEGMKAVEGEVCGQCLLEKIIGSKIIYKNFFFF
jgi:hypothetical protein